MSCVFNGITVEAQEKFEVKEAMAEPEGQFAVVTKVTASADDGNLPIHTIDRDPDSRWSADGKGQYLQLELEQQTEVGQVSIQFYNGHTRSNYFDLEISTDGINYHKVLSNVASQNRRHMKHLNLNQLRPNLYVMSGKETNPTPGTALLNFGCTGIKMT